MLVYEIRVLLVLPHRYQPKKSKYPKTKKLASSGENVHFLFGGTSKCWVDGHLILFFIMHL
ncbi:hypothetical protein DN392_15830 [Bacillus sp. BB51/4]|nr:hypothetical protein DN392_15830 [Bacillus sp. BB51/4]TCD33669.1 hypothetical protein E0D84_07525 [Bacillus wiedmannii]